MPHTKSLFCRSVPSRPVLRFEVARTHTSVQQCLLAASCSRIWEVSRGLMPRIFRLLIWIAVAAIGAVAVATIALHRGEEINAMWLVVAAFCCYALGYRFYSG